MSWDKPPEYGGRKRGRSYFFFLAFFLTGTRLVGGVTDTFMTSAKEPVIATFFSYCEGRLLAVFLAIIKIILIEQAATLVTL